MSLSLDLARRAIRGVGADPARLYQKLSAASIRTALREQNLTPLCESLGRIVPDLSTQYTAGFDACAFKRYWGTKMRGLHAFQTSCALEAISEIGRSEMTIVDLGDSSGNHATYLRALAPSGTVKRVVSVNLDEQAVRKINAKGGEAIHSRIEDIDLGGIQPDLLLSFETLEHILDPLGFLHGLASAPAGQRLLLSVPYRRQSRFGGALIRRPLCQIPAEITPEETHIFELSPEDWSLLARFAGFKTRFTRIYYQYPRRSIFRMTAPLWRKLDFEGFLALFLERDPRLANRYTGW